MKAAVSCMLSSPRPPSASSSARTPRTLSKSPYQQLTWMLETLQVAPSSRAMRQMRSIASSPRGGTSSRKSTARSKRRKGWSAEIPQPGTSARTRRRMRASPSCPRRRSSSESR